MGFMASEVYDALIEAGASEAKARAAAEVIPISHELATKADLAGVKADLAGVKADLAGVKADIAEIKVFVMRVGITLAGLAVLLNKFLDWVIR